VQVGPCATYMWEQETEAPEPGAVTAMYLLGSSGHLLLLLFCVVGGDCITLKKATAPDGFRLEKNHYILRLDGPP
jgi:hypothetical protein